MVSLQPVCAPPYNDDLTPEISSKIHIGDFSAILFDLEDKTFKLWLTYGNRIDECEHMGRKYKRIKVKGHYRDVIRNSDGRFKKVKKWSSKKER